MALGHYFKTTDSRRELHAFVQQQVDQAQAILAKVDPYTHPGDVLRAQAEIKIAQEFERKVKQVAEGGANVSNIKR